MINTKSVRDRRRLRFQNFDEVLADAEMLAEAKRLETLRVTGNWALGQTIGHLAFWANAPFDGYPTMRRPPLMMRLMLPLMKYSILNKGMPAGIRIPDAPDGTFGVEPMATDEALGALRRAYDRLRDRAPTNANPILGAMSHEDWVKLNLRHAELHLSFFHPA
jgi:Protein of unknown function (DUF1569)